MPVSENLRSISVPVYTREWLEYQLKTGKQFNYYAFWGTRFETRKEKSFSNFFMSPFNFEVLEDKVYTFSCVEQYFMWRKAQLFGDEYTAERLLQRGLKAADYKKLGREVQGYEEKVWDEVRYGVMLSGLYLKYTQNEELKRYLLETGDSILVEASPYDYIWGIGFRKSDAECTNPFRWKGKNLLGFALMELRDMLKTEK